MSTTEIWTYPDHAVATVDLTGFEVEATDGALGRVDEATGAGGGSYIVVQPSSLLGFRGRFVVPAGVIDTIDVTDRRIRVSRSREEIRNAPEYDPTRGLEEEYRSLLGSYYSSGKSEGRRARPAREPTARTATNKTTRARTTSDEPTKAELYDEAKRLDVEGRSKMSKADLRRAVERARGRGSDRGAGPARAKANPIEVQKFLEGVSYPTRRGELLEEAKRQGASSEVRDTLERLPEGTFDDPTEVSEAIGDLSQTA